MHVNPRNQGGRADRRSQAERREATRARLIAAARALFAARGYAGVGTEEIVQRAGVTRGALYHHFADKHDLFRAVYERVERELTERIVTDVPLVGDPVAVLRDGTARFLDLCLEPEVQRIALLDAPAVLGYESWRAIGERYGLGLIQAALQSAVDVGAIPAQPVPPLAHVLLGALDEAALLIARAEDVASARRQVGGTLDRLLTALTAPPSTLIGEFTQQAESFNASAVANAPETLDELLRLAAPRGDERWLDAACGPGVVSRALAPRVREVHGVDATPAMVELARREAAGLDNATFAVGDATALTASDGSFDGALTRFAIHHVPLPGRLFEELARVVRPGGKVVVADHLADAGAEAAAWAQEIERLRDPSHWASLPLTRLRALGADARLTLEAEAIVALTLDYEDWLRRGSGGATARPLIERALASPPAGADCFRFDGGALELRMWMSRWRR